MTTKFDCIKTKCEKSDKGPFGTFKECEENCLKYKKLTRDQSFDFLSCDEPIQVFWIESETSAIEAFDTPAMQAMHPLLTFNINHVGIGFKTKNTKFYLDFLTEGMVGAVLPEVVDNKGVRELKWNNSTYVSIGDFTDNYWTKSSYVATISKKQFMNLKHNILNDFLPNNLHYVLFSLSKNNSVRDLLNPVFNNTVCDTFAIYVLNVLQQKLNVPIDYLVKPHIAISSFISNTPPVKETNMNLIIDYYETLTAKFNSVKEKTYEFIMKLIKDYNIKDDTDRNVAIMEDLLSIQEFWKTVFDFANKTIYYHNYEDGKVVYYKVILDSIMLDLNYLPYPIKRNVEYYSFQELDSLKGSKCWSKIIFFGISIIMVIAIIVLLTRL
jgi:hypothetical protein